MATRIKTWQIVEGKLEAIESSLVEEGRTEAYDLEAWIASNPSIVGPDLIIIGRQVPTKSGPLDLLAVDRDGNLVVIERIHSPTWDITYNPSDLPFDRRSREYKKLATRQRDFAEALRTGNRTPLQLSLDI